MYTLSKNTLNLKFHINLKPAKYCGTFYFFLAARPHTRRVLLRAVDAVDERPRALESPRPAAQVSGGDGGGRE
jgi:hypothetical protein